MLRVIFPSVFLKLNFNAKVSKKAMFSQKEGNCRVTPGEGSEPVSPNDTWVGGSSVGQENLVYHLYGPKWYIRHLIIDTRFSGAAFYVTNCQSSKEFENCCSKGNILSICKGYELNYSKIIALKQILNNISGATSQRHPV